MTPQESKQLLLDIAMNCHRIGNWIADDYEGKKHRIDLFFSQTQEYLRRLHTAQFSPVVQAAKQSFIEAFKASRADVARPDTDRLLVAERLMTWGNILTHRSTLV